MKKICFGIAVMLFGLCLSIYVDGLIVVTSLLGLGISAWGMFIDKAK